MRVAAIAVALFVAAWAGLFVQLVSGHDPALASNSSTVAAQSADAAVTDDGTSDGAAGDGSSAVLTASDSSSFSTSGAEPSGADAATQSSAPAAVTTGQS